MHNLIKACLYGNVPILIWGPPGAGKTSTVRDCFRQMGRRCITVIASYREPADFGGLPIVSRERLKIGDQEFTVVELAPPKYAVEAAQNPEGCGIFMDEITCTPPAVQSPLLRAVHEKVVGELHLPEDKVAVLAAANPPEQAAGGWELAPPLANRFTHVDYKVDTNDWVEQFPIYWGNPPTIKLWGEQLDPDAWARKRSLVASYIHIKQSQLNAFPTSQEQQGRAWPSCRSWDNVSRILVNVDRFGLSGDEQSQLIYGSVGDGVGNEFCSWVKNLDLPDPEELIKNPDKVRMPKRGDQQFAVLASVAAAVILKNTPDRWLRGWQVMVNAAKQAAPDIAATAARMLAKNQPPRCDAAPPEANQIFGPVLKAAGLINKTERARR